MEFEKIVIDNSSPQNSQIINVKESVSQVKLPFTF